MNNGAQEQRKKNDGLYCCLSLGIFILFVSFSVN